ncbi:MAG: Trk family potassium uptake protein [Chloroflexi bacterium]|nr:Trk family potassium uptake protein [Chloroflexota bacterium]
MIVVGTILLLLPFATSSGQSAGLLTALFTATSAVCVTGLIVVDTGKYWSPFGQGVILVLIQLGGLGFMTSSTLLFLLLGRRITLRERMLIGGAVGSEHSPGGMVRLVRRIILLTLAIEAAGVVYLVWRFSAFPRATALWQGVFHSVSAFNNSGFSLFSDSLTGYQLDVSTLMALAVLIILGGISYTLLADVARFRRFRRLTVDSRIVLVSTVVLLAIGTLFILLAEAANPGTLGPMTWPHKVANAFFHAVMPRTAGFNSLNVASFMQPTLFFNMILMFIGAASGSTGGGIKVNTVGILVAATVSTLRGRPRPEAFGRELVEEQLHRALLLVALGLGAVFGVAFALSLVDNHTFVEQLFESFSAFGTVGLSMGITPTLSVAGQLLIIITMFVGRLGPLTLALSLTQRRQVVRYRYAKEAVKIG